MIAAKRPANRNNARSRLTATDERSELQSTTDPCSAPDGHYWVYAHSPVDGREQGQLLVGKWLIRMDCPYVEHYWGLIRDATEDGTLGISAKISTDWGRLNDPAGPRRNHIVCVYTRDWRDEVDVLRVATRLRDVGAVKKMLLTYKPDIFTHAGRYEGDSPGEVAIYQCKAPYEHLVVDVHNRAAAEALFPSSGQL